MAFDSKQFEQIVQKMEALKTKRAKAEGVMESEQKNWKAVYGVSTVGELEAVYTQATEELDTLQAKIDGLTDELKGLTNWSLL